MQNNTRDRLVELLIDSVRYTYEDQADYLIENDVVPVVRCKDCKYSRELDKHCEINRNGYLHCALLKGDETKYVWHKYKKYYKDYSLVEPDDYCSYGERKDDNG